MFHPLGRLLSISIGVLILASMAQAKEESKEKPANVTVAVRKAIKKLFPDGEVVSVQKVRTKNLRRFDAVIKDKAGEHWVRFRPNGSVVERKDPIEEDALPGPVKKALKKLFKKRFPKGKFLSAKQCTKHKKVTYVISVESNGTHTIKMDEEGKDLASE